MIYLTSCDPVHDLTLKNASDKPVEVFVFPVLDSNGSNRQRANPVQWRGSKMSTIVLKPSESLSIGRVFARYAPQVDDLSAEFLEIHVGADTIRLQGRDTIFSRIKKVRNLDWRLTIGE